MQSYEDPDPRGKFDDLCYRSQCVLLYEVTGYVYKINDTVIRYVS